MGTRRKIGLGAALLAAALTGTAAAVVFARQATPDASLQRPARPVASSPSTRPPPGAQRDNRFLLSGAESLRLVAWARRLRTCLSGRGLHVGEPVAYAKQIDLRLYSDGSPAELSPTITGCGDQLGEPPQRSSLQFRPGKLVLYLPRQCLLDPKVRSRSTAPA